MKLKLIIITLFIFTLCLFQLNAYAENNISQNKAIDIKVDNIGYKSADISWVTTGEVKSTLLYWESQFYSPNTIETIQAKDHKVSLNNLKPNTKYFYQIYVQKPDLGLVVASDIYSFSTEDLYKIKDIKVDNIGYKSADISWSTTDEAESTLLYWESRFFSPNTIKTIKGKDHKVSLNSLRPNTKYYYQVYTDRPDLELDMVTKLDVTSEVYSFTTTENKITDIKVDNIGYKSAEISWNTTYEDKSTILFWSSKGDMVNKIETIESKEHKVSLPYLLPDTKYYYQIYSDISDLNRGNSSEVYSFNTMELFKITDIKEDNVGDESAEISWNTTDEAKSTIMYWS
ncbi:MAG: fibronectin type III domain-containing protein, partial [Bacillota bacterium]|nr:fibronectin type III domain-containing protein [Bacillota bacterium]